MDILHVATTLGIGGTQKSAEVLARELSSMGHNISICGYYKGGARVDLLQNAGIQVHIANGEEKEFQESVAEANPDIIHFHGDGISGRQIELAKNTGIEKIVKTSNFGWKDDPEYAKLVDSYLFISKMTLLRYNKLHRRSRKDEFGSERLLYYPVPDESGCNNTGGIREDLGIDQDIPVLGKIGRKDMAKWSLLLVEAFDRVVEKEPDVHLVMVSPPTEILEGFRERELSSNISVLNEIPPGKVKQFYEAIDILAHASNIGESFGYVLAEAMNHKTPVVVNSTPLRDNAQVELVNHGENGYIANHPESYANAILELIEKKETARSMGDEARRSVRNRFSASLIAKRAETIYKEVLEDDYAVEEGIANEFEEEYNQRLRTSYGVDGFEYHVEKSLWDIVTRLPMLRKKAYFWLRRAYSGPAGITI